MSCRSAGRRFSLINGSWRMTCDMSTCVPRHDHHQAHTIGSQDHALGAGAAVDRSDIQLDIVCVPVWMYPWDTHCAEQNTTCAFHSNAKDSMQPCVMMCCSADSCSTNRLCVVACRDDM